MTATGDMTEDRGFKGVCALHAQDAFAFFGAELISRHGGPPQRVNLVQQEVFSHDLGDPGTIVDVALLGTWADGSTDLLLLIEHHAEIRKVRREGMAHYITSMIRRHLGTDVFPVLFVTDRSDQPIPDHFLHVVGGKQILRADWTVVRITAADLPRLRRMQSNKIAALLMSLTGEDSPEVAVATVQAMINAGYAFTEIMRLLPLIARFAKMTDEEQPRFRQLIHDEVPQMRTFIDDDRDQAKAEGQIAGILLMVTNGLATAAAARTGIANLVAAGTVTQAQADEALAKLPKRSARRTSTATPKKQKRRR